MIVLMLLQHFGTAALPRCGTGFEITVIGPMAPLNLRIRRPQWKLSVGSLERHARQRYTGKLFQESRSRTALTQPSDSLRTRYASGFLRGLREGFHSKESGYGFLA